MEKALKYGLVILFLAIGSQAFSQKEGHIWYFGEDLLLDFNFEPPRVDTSPAERSPLSSTSVSDEFGNLIAYTPGKRIYNQFHQVVSNGSDLYPSSTTAGGGSASQGCLALPVDENYIYFFLLYSIGNSYFNLTYSILDPIGNNGQGEVISKKLVLTDSLTRQMTAARHANGKDWWVMVHEKNTRQFRLFLLNQNGLNLFNTFNLGLVIGDYPVWGGSGTMKFSPDGKKLAMCDFGGEIQVLDFDRCQGELSNPRIIHKGDSIHFYGLEFSPDSKLLYVSEVEEGNTLILKSRLHQLNLDKNSIWTNRVQLWASDSSQIGMYHDMGGIKLGPNGKIYVVHSYKLPSGWNECKYLGVIHNPNGIGQACNFAPESFSLLPENAVYGEPNLPNYALGPLLPAQPANAGDNQEYCIGREEVQLGVPDTSGGVVQWSWSPTDGLSDPNISNPLVSPEETTTYILTAWDTTIHPDCGTTYDTVTVTVDPCNFEVPNIITPNGDGINDQFFIKNLPPQSRLSIFDRWGNQWFSTDDYQNNWPDSDDEVPDGVYFYILQTPDNGKLPQFVNRSGNLTLMR